MYFRNYGFRKTLLDKCPKGRISENLSTINVVNGIKLCENLNDTTFTIFIDHWESN